MSFSKRVGMEPAADLMKRIRSLCEEAGFVVAQTQSTLLRKQELHDSFRVITADIHEPGWNPKVRDGFLGTDWEELKECQIAVLALIGCDGAFNGTVEVRCSATDEIGDAWAPTLRDCKIPIAELPTWLPKIAQQMHAVIAARNRGEPGPWCFEDEEMRWEEIRIGL